MKKRALLQLFKLREIHFSLTPRFRYTSVCTLAVLLKVTCHVTIMVAVIGEVILEHRQLLLLLRIIITTITIIVVIIICLE